MSLVDAELREAPEAVARQEQALVEPLNELARRLARSLPALVVTCARGSSAHAAVFAKQLIERRLGLPVAPAAPVIATAYRRDLRLAGPAGDGPALPTLPSDHADADALCLIQSFYKMAPPLAAARGFDPDHPRHLQKVTRTR